MILCKEMTSFDSRETAAMYGCFIYVIMYNYLLLIEGLDVGFYLRLMEPVQNFMLQ